MKIRLIRHATMLLSIGSANILVDPMFSPAGKMDPVSNSANELRNPLVELPVSVESLLGIDAVLVTHTHRDHFDEEAARVLPKNIPVFCQPEDMEKIRAMGFTKTISIQSSHTWNGILFTRTGGRHGTGKTGIMMGPVSGYVLQTPKEPSLYIAGDTVWCPEVVQSLEAFQPQITVVYSGAARFLTGDPITMAAGDIAKVCRNGNQTRVLAVHMEAFNHCALTRKQLREYLEQEGLSERVIIPADGEWLDF